MQTQTETKALEEAARADVRRVLDKYPEGAPVVLLAIEEGRIDGRSSHLRTRWSQEGKRGCFGAHVNTVTTCANVSELFGRPLFGEYIPIENYIMDVRPGETHLTNERLSGLYCMVREWMAEREALNGNSR